MLFLTDNKLLLLNEIKFIAVLIHKDITLTINYCNAYLIKLSMKARKSFIHALNDIS